MEVEENELVEITEVAPGKRIAEKKLLSEQQAIKKRKNASGKSEDPIVL